MIGVMRTQLMHMAFSGLAAICLVLPIEARILSVKPVHGVPGKIISAPSKALDDVIASSTHMVGFDERQGVLLTRDIRVDGGTIARGTRVNSHMILFNLPDDPPRNSEGAADSGEWFYGAVAENEWIFSGPVLGVMSDTDGLLEAATTEMLGAPKTIYPSGSFFLRGFEDNDSYDGVGTRRLMVRMSVWQPGDWIRVITGIQPVAAVPAGYGPSQFANNPGGEK